MNGLILITGALRFVANRMDAIDRYRAARGGTTSSAPELSWLWYVVALVVVAAVVGAMISHLRKRASVIGGGQVHVETSQPSDKVEINIE